MSKKIRISFFVVLAFIMASLLILQSGTSYAAEQEMVPEQEQEQIYGSELMTPMERAEYRTMMRSATSDEEREKIRMEHHEQMQERANEMGVELPDMPAERGMGYGSGMGPGKGMGSGSGMGPGKGMGSGSGMGRGGMGSGGTNR